MHVLIGGVGYRWMGDHSFGLAVCDTLMQEPWPMGVEVADLGYGALYVSLDLLDRMPPLDRLVLISGRRREREPGELVGTRWQPPRRPQDDADVQARVTEAGAGVIDVDHLLAIAQRFGALPGDVYCVELEPLTEHGPDLSPLAAARVPEACRLVRELALAPLVSEPRSNQERPVWH
ncbi:MAG TPA: hypothetical protein VE714_06960 [Gemmatimonadales bacterium]|nr:hypothetical protein [Gemmatimonadales bacterium]